MLLGEGKAVWDTGIPWLLFSDGSPLNAVRHIGGAELEQLFPNVHGCAPEDGGVRSPSEAFLLRALPLVVLPGEHLQLRLPRPLQPPGPVGKVRRPPGESA